MAAGDQEARLIITFDDKDLENLVQGMNKKISKEAKNAEKEGKEGKDTTKAKDKEAEASEGLSKKALQLIGRFEPLQKEMGAMGQQFIGLAKIVAPAAVLGGIFYEMSSTSGAFMASLGRLRIFTIKIGQIFGEALAPILNAIVALFTQFLPFFEMFAGGIKAVGSVLINIINVLGQFKEAIAAVIGALLLFKIIQAAYAAGFKVGGPIGGAAAATAAAVGGGIFVKGVVDEIMKGKQVKGGSGDLLDGGGGFEAGGAGEGRGADTPMPGGMSDADVEAALRPTANRGAIGIQTLKNQGVSDEQLARIIGRSFRESNKANKRTADAVEKIAEQSNGNNNPESTNVTVSVSG